jgi:hypothetical protein
MRKTLKPGELDEAVGRCFGDEPTRASSDQPRTPDQVKGPGLVL